MKSIFFFFYAVLSQGLSPFLRLWLWVRVYRKKEIRRNLPERRGIETLPRPQGELIWLHAASVGEVTSVFPLIPLLADRKNRSLLVTTGTLTSAKLVSQYIARLKQENELSVIHRFVPWDVPSWAERFLKHWRPSKVIFTESEIWPNLIRLCSKRSVPLILINGRLSPRSYQRWRKFLPVARGIFEKFSLILARSPEEATEFKSLGAREVAYVGDLKLAAGPLPVNRKELAALQSSVAGYSVFVAAATHQGEEEIILATYRLLSARLKNLLTIILPRHPERGAEIALMLKEKGGFTVPRRSLGQNFTDFAALNEARDEKTNPVWLADTLGETGLFYRLADCVFVGGSLLPAIGGHNFFEPVRLGVRTATGPFTDNFKSSRKLTEEKGLLVSVTGAEDLAGFVTDSLQDKKNPDTARQLLAAREALFAATDDILTEFIQRTEAVRE